MSNDKSTVRVFISSTFEDLKEERSLVLDAIRQLKFQHIAMEYFNADPRRSIEVCLEEVQKSDIYVGIIAHRYGTIVKETGKSYTQMEYEEAVNNDLPCFIYLRSDDYAVPPRNMEKNPESMTKLDQFKSTLRKKHTPAYFNDGHDLAIKIVINLSEQIKSLDNEVLDNIVRYVLSRFRRIQKDNDSKFHYLQKRLENLGLIELAGPMCPVCGRLLETEELPLTFGYKHPVCTDCMVHRTEDVIRQLKVDHPEFLEGVNEVKKYAQEYLLKRNKSKSKK